MQMEVNLLHCVLHPQDQEQVFEEDQEAQHVLEQTWVDLELLEVVILCIETDEIRFSSCYISCQKKCS